jgi:hypothetical protein
MARAVFGTMIIVSGIVQAVNIYKTVTTDTHRLIQVELTESLPEPEVAA